MNEKKKIKALWKHEFRMCKGFLIVGCLIALLGLLYVYIISYIDRGFDIGFVSTPVITDAVVWVLFFASIGLFIGIPFMTSMQYMEQKVKNTGEFMYSLPVKRKTLLEVKVGVGLCCISIPCILFLAGSILIWKSRIQYICVSYLDEGKFSILTANDTWLNITANVAMFWLMAVTLYAFSHALQAVVKPCFIAGIITIAASIAPCYFFNMVAQMGDNCGYHVHNIYKLADSLNVWNGRSLAVTAMSNKNATLRLFLHPGRSVLIYLLVIAVSFALVCLYYNRQQLEDSKHFIVTKKMSCAFKLCTSACISAGLIAYRYNLTNNIVVVVSLFAALTALAYYILNKAIQRYE